MLEDILIFPFVAWGRWRASKSTLGADYEIFLFFPFYHVGGAEKVHAFIARVFKDRKAVIVFTRKSENDALLPYFRATGLHIIDISKNTDDKWKYWQNLVYRGKFSYHINRVQGKVAVINGQCNFAYKLSPWINRKVSQVELIHSFNSFSYIRLPFLPLYDATVMISRRRIDDHLRQYRQWGVPALFDGKIHHIVNGIDLPGEPQARSDRKDRLRILYAGRATPEKRVQWIAALAKKSRELALPADFIFMGEVKQGIPQSLHAFCLFLGNLSVADEISKQYQLADIVIISSSTEGFPMVVEEGMSWGCAILATPVGDIPYHVKPGENGLLFDENPDEQSFVAQGVEFIRKLLGEPGLLTSMSGNNIRYAREKFGFEKFRDDWRQLIENASSTKNHLP